MFLDYIQQRPQGWKEAETIFFLAMNGDISLMISDLTIANVRYITRKNIPLEQFYVVMKALRHYYTIVPLGSDVVDKAYIMEAKDFEDALQYFSAEQAVADCLVTRNIKHFDFASSVEVLEPHDFLSKYFPEELQLLSATSKTNVVTNIFAVPLVGGACAAGIWKMIHPAKK